MDKKRAEELLKLNLYRGYGCLNSEAVKPDVKEFTREEILEVNKVLEGYPKTSSFNDALRDMAYGRNTEPLTDTEKEIINQHIGYKIEDLDHDCVVRYHMDSFPCDGKEYSFLEEKAVQVGEYLTAQIKKTYVNFERKKNSEERWLAMTAELNGKIVKITVDVNDLDIVSTDNVESYDVVENFPKLEDLCFSEIYWG